MNGINKETISEKSLLALYQRYLGYEKSVNMEQFIDASSTYRLYLQMVMGQFSVMTQAFETQNDSQMLAVANETRTKALTNFSNQRQRQVDLDTIIKSYKSVMGEIWAFKFKKCEFLKALSMQRERTNFKNA